MSANTQEYMRLIIELLKVVSHRSDYLNHVQECNETSDAISALNMAIDDVRLALYSYEVRAYRRKQAQLNKEAGKHDDSGDMNATRTGFKDIPFGVDEIENRPVGEDGHLL